MEEVYIVAASRTPIGSFGGALASVPAPTLAAGVIQETLRRSGIGGKQVNEVILGQVLQGGSAQAPARQAMRAAGIPDTAHAMTINKVCGSGLKSVMLGTDCIRLGDADIAVTGGMESMSGAPYALPTTRFGQRMGNATALDLMLYDGLLDPYSGRHMGDITEDWVAANDLSRQEQDRFASRSYQRAQKAVKSGLFAREIIPVTIPGRKGETVVSQDEEPFRGSIEKLSTLRPAFRKDGSITAGNASTISDGAGILLLASAAAVKQHKLTPIARFVSHASYSQHPDLFAGAPVGAIQRCVEKAGLSLDQIDLFEINEAFAAVPLAAIRELGLEEEKVNVNGGACAMGHPLGASGARLATTVIHELQAQNSRYGLATLCIGGGEAVAVIFERL